MSPPSIFCPKKLKNLEKSGEGHANDSSPISRLPDEIILLILNRLIDLKTLCFCYLVSKRFSSIVLQVDAISFASLVLNPKISDKNTIPSRSFLRMISSLYGESFLSAYRFLIKFKGVKSLCIELLAPGHRAVDSRLFKWKVNFTKKIESFIFLWPNSIWDKDGLCVNGNGDEEESLELIGDLFKKKRVISFQCLQDIMALHVMLLYLVNDLPMLEEVSISDLERRGRLSLSGKKLSEVKEWVHSASETVLNRINVPTILRNCYIPFLKLPVSGYVMKGIYFCVMEMKDMEGGNEFLMSSENGGFEDKEESAYTEAMMEILKKHKGMMLTRNLWWNLNEEAGQHARLQFRILEP
ncbi:F-box protein AUF2 [Lactuca sativa]|uniref:F-box domain-containing protein n=1 Tax=Lactuca sativa TaxID=4236 RepID=A0A9R1W5V1_LACSA|nr:F-box protein AUF2 [Lactuca sativa]KAJ0217683.1 hypothetical protein LSAT_V11C300146890 [Lactuca sativa]